MTDAPSPNLSIIVFLIITIIYFISRYLNGQSIVHFIIYIITLVVSSLFINMHLTNTLCGSTQFGTAIRVTIFPWLIIFGLLKIMLIQFPGWLIPFSNTFGYGIAGLAGLRKAFIDVLKPKIQTKNKQLSEALDVIYKDPSLMINEIPNSTDGFDLFWEESKQGGIIKSGLDNTSDPAKALRKFVELKNIIAEFMWFILTGLLTLSASYNYIINSGCNRSIQEMEDLHREYEENIKEPDPGKDIQQRVYSTHE